MSVLDLSPVAAGRSAAHALAGTVALARRAEALGCRRFWVAEHHDSPSIASTAPETLIAHLAARTRRIRVGAGGVMLPNHAPLAVAERFGMLEALHPGRIDLGLGRDSGTNARVGPLLRRADPERFAEHLAELRAYLGSGHGGIRAVAGEHAVPQLWMLGSSEAGARTAAELGLPFVFATHFHPHLTEPALALYRERFVASDLAGEPRVIVCAGVVIAQTDEEAARLALPGGVATLWRRQGRPAALPSPSLAHATVQRLSGAELAVVRDAIGRLFVGGPATVVAGLSRLVERSGADELMITSPVADPDARIRGLEHIAAAFGLARQGRA
ncbi:MAG: LLM class flavin-dependent oxidoreductase [Solirubrobacteraceae bacterium]|nr:LLM class flavin-dependent oxidoreductase [Solirubrobacteraceae bacterium]